MINRVLIRIKVVQLLYSYLLLEEQFLLEPQPTPPTKEKRFAYSLYLDMLVMMTRIAENVTRRGGDRPLLDNRFISAVLSDDKIKSLCNRYRMQGFPFAAVEDKLTEAVKESGIYKLFIKHDSDTTGNAEVSVWKELFDKVILPNPELQAVISTRENYTLRGVDRAAELMRTTFTNFFSSQGHLTDALKSLSGSLDMARELYMRLLLLPVEITRLREREMEINRRKYITTHEDLNPNMRFVENQFVTELSQNLSFQKYVETKKISWRADNELLLNSLLKAIKESDIYKDYMEFPVTDYKTDCEFWRNIYRHVIFENPDFLEALEDKSVFWNDDLDIIGTFILKTVKRFENDEKDSAVLPMYKDDEDARFGAELFTAAVKGKEVYRSYINRFVNRESWDSDRLAFMDVVVMIAALAEIINFPKIPVNVSINEYIEIAKSYSTPRSGNFINGILGAAVASLREEGKIPGKE